MSCTRLLVLATVMFSLISPARATAAIHNIGVDIGSNGSQTIVPFFDESSSGYELYGESLFGWIPGQALTIVLDTASIFGAGPLASAELFIDAFHIDSWNTSEVYIQGVLVGSLQNTPSPSVIPTIGGGHTVNSGYDVDNSMFDLTPFLTGLASDATFTIQIRNTTDPFLYLFPGEKIRIDGINIQAVSIDPLPVVVPNVAPEPSAIAVWALLAGAAIVVSGTRLKS